MAAKDLIHNAVKQALIKDGWTVTDDPYTLAYAEDVTVFVDLGAERLIAAQRDLDKIAVEIKTFGGPSAIHDMEVMLGQYFTYRSFLEEIEPERRLYVAISTVVYATIFQRPSFQLLQKKGNLALIIVDLVKEEIALWIR